MIWLCGTSDHLHIIGDGGFWGVESINSSATFSGAFYKRCFAVRMAKCCGKAPSSTTPPLSHPHPSPLLSSPLSPSHMAQVLMIAAENPSK
jgi:hypothetical protein